MPRIVIADFSPEGSRVYEEVLQAETFKELEEALPENLLRTASEGYAATVLHRWWAYTYYHGYKGDTGALEPDAGPSGFTFEADAGNGWTTRYTYVP